LFAGAVDMHALLVCQLIHFGHFADKHADRSDYARAGALLVYEPESHSRAHRYLLVWEFSF